jgi:hypothetical protein
VENTLIPSRATLVVVPSPCKDIPKSWYIYLTSCRIA